MTTNQIQKFQQRWEFRRGGDDGYSSDDDDLNSSSHGINKKPSIVNHLLSHNDDDDEVTNDPTINTNDTEVMKKKVKSNKNEAKVKAKTKEKEKKVVPNKSIKSLEVTKGRDKKRKRNLVCKEMVMLDDLKIFAASLIHEVKVVREDILAQVKMSTSSKQRKKNKQNESSIERSMKSNITSDASDAPKGAPKGEKLHVSTIDSNNRVVSSPFLTPKPLVQQGDVNSTMNDRIPHTMDAEYRYQFGLFPHTSIGFHSKMSNQTCTRDHNATTLKFSGENIKALSEYVMGNGSRSNVQLQHTSIDEEFVPLRLQEQLANDKVYYDQLASFGNRR